MLQNLQDLHLREVFEGHYCLKLREPRAIRTGVSGKLAVLAEESGRWTNKKQTEACGRTYWARKSQRRI